MIAGLTLVFAVAATAAGVLAPERMRLMVAVATTGSVSDVVLPIGHWLLAAMWIGVVAALVPDQRREVVLRGVVVAVVLHVVLLVALFVPRLSDREAFTAGVYLLYARVFCATAAALATAWSMRWVQRVSANRDSLTVLELPIVVGSLALLIAVARYNVPMAVASAIVGVIVWSAWRWRPLRINDVAFVAAVFVIAVSLRLLYVSRIMSDANYLDAGADGRVYDELAWSIASGSGIPDWFSARFPLLLLGYVYFVAAVYKVAGHSYLAITAVQSLLGAAACLLLYDLARRVFSVTVARVAAVFMALSFPLLFAAATLGHQAFDVFLTVLIAWMALRLAAGADARWAWAPLGMIVGLAFAVRETNIFLAAFMAVWIGYVAVRAGRGVTWPTATFAVGAALVVLPFLAPKVLNASDRAAMLVHFDRLYRGEGEGGATLRTDIVAPMSNPGAALAQLRSEPLHVISTLTRAYARNLAVQFLTQPYGGFDLVFLRKGAEYYYGMWFYAYALTIAGTAMLVRELVVRGPAAPAALLVLGIVASRTLPHVFLESDYRHRVPIEPFLILLASIAVVGLVRAVMASAANVSTSGFTGSDWRVSQSSGTWTPVT